MHKHTRNRARALRLVANQSNKRSINGFSHGETKLSTQITFEYDDH